MVSDTHREVAMNISSASATVLWRQTLELWAFGMLKLPLLTKMRPRVVSLPSGGIGLSIPLSRTNRNQYGTMSFAALVSCAEMLSGVLAFTAGREAGSIPFFVIRAFEGTLERPARGPVLVRESSTGTVAEAVRVCREEKRTLDQPVRIEAVVKSPEGETLVGAFSFTLHLRPPGFRGKAKER